MKIIKYISFLLLAFTVACSKDSKEEIPVNNVLEGTKLVAELKNSSHTIEIYGKTTVPIVGYNQLFLKIKDLATNQYVSNAELKWTPVMTMTDRTHSCPTLPIVKSDLDNTVYTGAIVFQMASNPDEYWNLKVDYNIGETTYTANANVNVENPTRRKLQVVLGTDNKKYIVAFKEPSNPKVGVNDMHAYIFTMQDMMTFSMVNALTLKIDPRMPGMGNHGSPNNVALTQPKPNDIYAGKLNLTMTGYWKINLQLLSTNSEVLYGEELTDSVDASTLFFEIEF